MKGPGAGGWTPCWISGASPEVTCWCSECPPKAKPEPNHIHQRLWSPRRCYLSVLFTCTLQPSAALTDLPVAVTYTCLGVAVWHVWKCSIWWVYSVETAFQHHLK